MFKPQRRIRASLGNTLRELPDEFVVYVLEDGWLVVAPSGLFVVTDGTGDLAAAALRAADRADAVRLALSDELVWVPFVDAMCVTSDTWFDADQPCLVVPDDLVTQTLTSGPTRIDPETLERLHQLRYPLL